MKATSALPALLLVGPLALLLALLLAAPPRAAAQDLEERLSAVGEDYARGYLAPMASALGAAQLAGLSTTAAIPDGRLTATLGLRYAAVSIAHGDQRFRRVRHVVLDETYGIAPGSPYYGAEGDIVAEGPSVFGSEDARGRVTAVYQGAPVYSVDGIEGLYETRWPFLIVPEVSLSGVAHLRATVRWLPEIELGDVGVSLFGGGLAWGLADLLPRSPVEVAVGVFWQRLRVEDVVEAQATSWFATASRNLGLLTAYGTFALEDSDFEADYTFTRLGVAERIAFELDGEQSSRLALGATLHGGATGPRLTAEVGFGALTTLSAGVQAAF